MTSPMTLVSIITPAYNEEENIAVFAIAIREVFAAIVQQNIEMNYELIFVDDGSKDNTLKLIQSQAESDSHIHYVSFSRNFGHQAALKAGLDFAKGDAVISLDADLQHPVTLIPDMISKWKEGYDVVYTLRQDDERIGIFKKLTSHCFYKINALFSDISVPDGAADFRLCDRKVVDVLKTFSEPFLFWRGLVMWSGFKQFAIPYKALKRQGGTSKYSFRKMLNLAINGISSFSVRPLYISLFFGGLALLAFFIMLVIQIISYVLGKGGFSPFETIIMLLLVQFSILMVCLGILGEYVGKIFIMGKKRPVYIVQEQK